MLIWSFYLLFVTAVGQNYTNWLASSRKLNVMKLNLILQLSINAGFDAFFFFHFYCNMITFALLSTEDI